MAKPDHAGLKAAVKQHWEDETCGTRYTSAASRAGYFGEIEEARYRLEPYIRTFARFEESRGKRVLEIGVGAGTDFSNWVKFADKAWGVDLTERGIQLTGERLALAGVDAARYELRTADAESLPFEDSAFDLVYSWGVLHHSPDTRKAFAEAFRVTRSGGRVRAMIYHVHSLTGFLLWLYHGLAKGRPLRSVRSVVFDHLESPGTKTYTLAETRRLLEGVGFEDIRLSVELGPGDLLDIMPSRKYQGGLVRFLWKLYPRWLLRRWGRRFGLYLLIDCGKT